MKTKSFALIRIIHSAPFVPFVVLFFQVIEADEADDLARLEAFVSSIQSANGCTDASTRLCRLFRVLYNVALRYVEMRNNSQQAELDKYLAALGLPHSRAATTVWQPRDRITLGIGAGLGDLSQPTPAKWAGNTSQLEDWLYSN